MGKQTHTTTKPRRKPKTRERRTYTQDEQIRAVTAMISLGGMSYEGMQAARDIVGANLGTGTLGRWLNKYRDQVERQLNKPLINVPAIIDNTRGQIVSNLQSAMLKLSAGLNDEEAIKNAAYRDKGVVAGIITDKLRLIAGTDPEVDELWRDFEQACIDSGHDAKSFFRDIISSLKQAPANEPGPVSPGVLYREIDI